MTWVLAWLPRGKDPSNLICKMLRGKRHVKCMLSRAQSCVWHTLSRRLHAQSIGVQTESSLCFIRSRPLLLCVWPAGAFTQVGSPRGASTGVALYLRVKVTIVGSHRGRVHGRGPKEECECVQHTLLASTWVHEVPSCLPAWNMFQGCV